MTTQAQYQFQVSKWEKYGKTRLYLSAFCANVNQMPPETQRAHSRGNEYGYISLDLEAGMVAGWEYVRNGKSDLETSELAYSFTGIDGSNFNILVERLIEKAGFEFDAEYEKEVA